jgi:curved DNA-binding protein CbpA
MASVNLYNVLNLKESCDKQSIKNAYRKLVKKYHPDKGGDIDLYELITHAYNILINPESRKEYDATLKLSNDTEYDFNLLKKRFDEFKSAQENDTKDKSDIKKEFDKAFEEFDQRHGLQRDEIGVELPAWDAKQRMNDLEMTREQEDIENTQDQIFNENEKFDGKKFNQVWNQLHQNGISEMIVHDGNPLPWGTEDELIGAKYGEDNLYEESQHQIFGAKYSSIEQPKKIKKIKDLKKLNVVLDATEEPTPEEYKDLLAERIRQRDLETQKIADMEVEDFDNDDATMGGYGFSHHLGDISHIDWENNSDLSKKYQKMLQYRENEIGKNKKQ